MSFSGNIHFEIPNYNRCTLEFSKADALYQIGFLVDPQSVHESSSFVTNITPVLSGWHITPHGNGIGNLSLQGLLVDTHDTKERLNFLAQAQNFMTDGANDLQEYMNNFSQTITIEGVRYKGIISSLSMQKSMTRPFVYDFSLSFMFVSKRAEVPLDTDIKYSDRVLGAVDIDSFKENIIADVNDFKIVNVADLSAIFSPLGGEGAQNIINGEDVGDVMSFKVTQGVRLSYTEGSHTMMAVASAYSSYTDSSLKRFFYNGNSIVQYALVNEKNGGTFLDEDTQTEIKYFFVPVGKTFNMPDKYVDGEIPSSVKNRKGQIIYCWSVYYLDGNGQMQIRDCGEYAEFFIDADCGEIKEKAKESAPKVESDTKNKKQTR